MLAALLLHDEEQRVPSGAREQQQQRQRWCLRPPVVVVVACCCHHATSVPYLSCSLTLSHCDGMVHTHSSWWAKSRQQMGGCCVCGACRPACVTPG